MNLFESPNSSLDKDLSLEISKVNNEARKAVKRVRDGFKELVDSDFLKPFNEDREGYCKSQLKAITKQSLERNLKGFETRLEKIKGLDFLDKNSNYSKGLKANFNYKKIDSNLSEKVSLT